MTPITPTWLTQSTSEAQVKAAFEGALTAGFNTYLDPESGARNGLEARSFCGSAPAVPSFSVTCLTCVRSATLCLHGHGIT